MVFEHPPVTAHHSGSDRTDCRLDSLCLPIDDSEFTIRLGCLGTLLLGGENWTYKLEFFDRENVCDWYQVSQQKTKGSSVGVQVGVSCLMMS
jgi:hypothetical protein